MLSHQRISLLGARALLFLLPAFEGRDEILAEDMSAQFKAPIDPGDGQTETSILTSYNPFAEDTNESWSGQPSSNGEIDSRSTAGQEQEVLQGGRSTNPSRTGSRPADSKHRRQFSVRKLGWEKSGPKHTRQASRGLRPRIFVNTSLARLQGKSATSQHSRARSRSGPQDPHPPNRRFISLDTLRDLDADTSNHASKTRLPALKDNSGRPVQADPERDRQAGLSSTHAVGTAQPTSHSGHPVREQQYLSPNSAVDHQSDPSRRLRESLSPWDRAIPIGMAVLPEDHPYAPHSQNSFSPPPRKNKTEDLEEGADDLPLQTPTIVITQAKELPLPTISNRPSVPRSRPRVPSSVYSRRVSDWLDSSLNASTQESAAPQSAGTDTTWWRSDAGSDMKRDSTATVFEEDHSPQQRKAVLSTGTVFEEEGPQSSEPALATQDGPNRIGPLQISTSQANQHRRSTGWWNYITTPFLTRPNSPWSKPLSPDQDRDQDRPDVPDLAAAVARLPTQEQTGELPRASPVTPISPPSARPKDGHSSAWTNMSQWEQELNARNDVPPSHDLPSRTLSRSTTFDTDDLDAEMDNKAAVDSNRHSLFKDKSLFGHQSVDQTTLVETSPDPANAKGHEKKESLVPALYHTLSPNDREVPMVFGVPRNNLPHTTQPPSSNLAVQGLSPTPRPAASRNDTGNTGLSEGMSPTIYQADVVAVVRPGTAVTTVTSAARQRTEVVERIATPPTTRFYEPPPYSPPRGRVNLSKVPPASRSAHPLQEASSVSRDSSRQREHHPPKPRLMPTFPPPPTKPAASASRQTQPRHNTRWEFPPPPGSVPITARDLESRHDGRRRHEAKRQRGEKEDAVARKVGNVWQRVGLSRSNGLMRRDGTEARKKRRRCCCGLTIGGLLMIILIVVLATTLTRRKKDDNPMPSTWVNITGWPPIPTGVSSIISPDLEVANSGCVFPSTMWSCSLPKELQKPDAPGSISQPQLRFDISYLLAASQNSTGPRKRSIPETESPSAALSNTGLVERDSTDNISFVSVPDPPTIEDQRFIGVTTDKVDSARPEGELSPFSLALLTTTTPSTRRLIKRRLIRFFKRQSDEFPEIRPLIPPPELEADGTAKAANLLPMSVSQRMRLYNRGLESEHYGFYIYFDRSIFLKSTSLLNQSDVDRGEVPADRDGGSTRQAARVRCTWAQSRLLVQIWTNRDNTTAVQNNANSTSSSSTDSRARSDPEFFPYPVTITTDRHGGDIAKKMIYCYGLDTRERIVLRDAKLQVENRGFGGQLVGGGQGPLGKDKVSIAQGGLGGIDGGTGGCSCRWNNFVRQQ
ncbi:MAG: YmL10 [Watsoniomyces obsoletus]|nr:MAG: YmL10 [Watsoniomyces obsoletus]